ncbi:MAG: ribose ABC transporter permease [Atribacterales bacterium]
MDLSVKKIIRDNNTFVILIALIIVSSMLSPKFLSTTNLLNILRQATLVGLMAFGMTPIIISGGIDLSVGSMMAVASVLSSTLIQHHSVLMAIIIPLLLTMFLGMINGLIITKGNVQPFLATMAMMVIARGFSQIYVGGLLVQVFNEGFLYLGRGYFLGIPIPVIILLITFGVMLFLIKRTVLGISVYAIGGNEACSYLSGLQIDKVKIVLYTISGLLSGLSGLIYTSRLGAGYGMAGMYSEMDVIAAVVMGGTLMSGGVGTLTGTLWGVLIIGIIQNILNMLNVPAPYHPIVTSIILISAVVAQKRQ